jgi:hypothetical protein
MAEFVFGEAKAAAQQQSVCLPPTQQQQMLVDLFDCGTRSVFPFLGEM